RRLHCLVDLAVVDAGGQIVRRRCLRQVDPQFEVDIKALPQPLLLGEHAVIAEKPKIVEDDAVAGESITHGCGSSCCGGPYNAACATVSASRLARTSCTRNMCPPFV